MSEHGYGFFDRCLHRFAFATPWAQKGMADMEERIYKKELAAVRGGGPPVLVTALPRAGTTILLEMLAATETFAAHSYRDMPFVLSPMLWNGISRPFRRADAPRERAHGDGIQISLDSPEAFEEIVWLAFWKEHYGDASIRPWTRCDESEFVEFMRAHMRKVVALRARQKPTACRYASKNNLNIARIPALWGAFPDAIVVVPFRDPLQHAASLLRQHERFLAMHRDDDFVRRYMRGIGHFDFGANLAPVDFDGWLGGRSVHDEAHDLAFWLDYWIAAYTHVLAHADRERLHLVCFESLGQNPDLAPLARALEMDDPGDLCAQAKILSPAKAHPIDTTGLSSELVQTARDLYAQLAAR